MSFRSFGTDPVSGVDHVDMEPSSRKKDSPRLLQQWPVSRSGAWCPEPRFVRQPLGTWQKGVRSEGVRRLTAKTILLTGATGFVGRHAAIALEAAGYAVRATSRTPALARSRYPNVHFVHCDIGSPASVRTAMEGTHAAIYLYHGLGTGSDYPEREASAARAFLCAANEARLERILYLGGVAPHGPRSKHLESRLTTGRVLREGPTKTLELAAAMIIGHQSQSFTLVRDVVLRSPVLSLPSWLDHESCPVAICDVAAALAVGLRIPLETSAVLQLPGPETLSHRALIELLCAAFGTRLLDARLAHIGPELAAVGLAFLSRVDAKVSHELVAGLNAELVPEGRSFWSELSQPTLRSVREAMADAFADEAAAQSPSVETSRRIRDKTLDWLERLGVEP
ncbi:MAG: NAD(P)H-binding protein [Polyangiaceae bacterium]